MTAKKKKTSTIRVGDVILNSFGLKIGVSRMQAEIEGTVLEVALTPNQPTGPTEEIEQPVELVKLQFSCVLETDNFSVWQTMDPDETIAKFLLQPEMFIVPDFEFIDDAQKDIRSVERIRKMAESMGVLTVEPYSQLIDQLASYALYRMEKEKRGNAT